ncbi:MAG: hypothetical protein SVJ22_00925 [Halobacteriota archaeon]|nr:hypothetical protein [Halobacteriota archaeon]
MNTKMNYYNHKTRITASTIGVLLGLAGFINHGLFEILQGNTSTNGFMIEAIGKSHRYWIHGTEGAFTLIPNFLITGVTVLFVSLAIIIFSIKFLHKRYGATIFLLLLILLTLVGGGIGHIVLFLPTWAYATRINKPLAWWSKILPIKVRRVLAKVWAPMLVITSLSWFIVMELGIFGYFPGQTNPDIILNICFGFVLLTVLFANLSFICGFAQDIEERKERPN